MSFPRLRTRQRLQARWQQLRRVDLSVVSYYTRVYVREGWQLILRNRFLSIFASVTIFTLLTMGYALIVLNAHMNQVLTQADNNLIVTVVLDKDAQAPAVEQEIRKIPAVTKIVYISQEQSRDNLVRKTGIPSENTPKADFFPQILEVYTRNANSIASVAQQIQGMPGVAGKPDYLRGLVQQITDTTKSLRVMALFTIIFLGILSVALLMAIVRVTIYAKKKSVEIMSLVGASKATIIFPLLAQVFIITLAMGTLASVVGWLLDPQLGTSSVIAGGQSLPAWMRTTRAYGLFTLWPLIVPTFLAAASFVVIRTVNHYAKS